MSTSFDLVVIGSGSAGSAVATRCRDAGWNVAVVDERPFGGTCALRGCDPKKVLVGAAEAVDGARRLRGRGVTGDATIDWTALIDFKRSFTDPVPERKERAFRESGIEVVRGHARFVGPTTIEADGRALDSRHVVIAVGARPAALAIPGAELLATSDDFLELPSLPKAIVFVGGGYISFEFAHVAARAGASVTILHRGRRPLQGFDPDLVDALVRHTRELGIDVRTGIEVTHVERSADGVVVSARAGDRTERFAAGLAVHGAGRVPALDGLDLEIGGVAYTRRGVEVTPHLQSVSNPAVFAAGDAANRGPALTPVTGHDGRIVAANLLNGPAARAEYGAVPSVVFTIPPLSAVGLLEDAARSQGYDVEVRFADTSEWYSSRRLAAPSAYKTIVERATGRILGAHLFGPHAADVVNLIALAIKAGVTSADLKSALLAYPTGASDVHYML